jgi:hypothetical protein
LENTNAPIHAAGQVLKLVDASSSVIAVHTLTQGDVDAGTYRFTVGALEDGTYTYSTTISGNGKTAGLDAVEPISANIANGSKSAILLCLLSPS